MKNWIKFIGTAGARFVVAKQLRSSGGQYPGGRLLLNVVLLAENPFEGDPGKSRCPDSFWNAHPPGQTAEVGRAFE
jgi:hypothetical protein